MPERFPSLSAPSGSRTARPAESMLNTKSNDVAWSVRTAWGNSRSYADGAYTGVPSRAYNVSVSTRLSKAGAGNAMSPQAATTRTARGSRAVRSMEVLENLQGALRVGQPIVAA